MYEVLTINQLIDCLDNETPCYVIYEDSPCKIIIDQINFRFLRIQVFCIGKGGRDEEVDLSTIGLSEDHAWALQYSRELEKVQKTIKDAKELEEELIEKLGQFVKKENN